MKYDYLIIGAGIIGLSLALKLKEQNPAARILLIEKEKDVAQHSSGRNSGILHAGFYYSADSLKARLTVIGNQSMIAFCRRKNLPINHCGKLVVAKTQEEIPRLYELKRRGMRNGSNVKIVSEHDAKDIEPSVRTTKVALYSPDTASIEPYEVCRAIKEELLTRDIRFSFETTYLKKRDNVIETTQGFFEARKIINCAGLYADKIARDFGFGKDFTILPFKGLYLNYAKNTTDIKINIYPVPDMRNPFLGVHFTKTVTGAIKIGPTAIPVFWRENYRGFENFRWDELCQIACQETKLFLLNSFGFRNLAMEEMKKYYRPYFIRLATDMVDHVDPKGFSDFTRPGIRAQLLNKTSRELVQDFVIEGDSRSIHILNAVSPAFTCAFPFGEFVVKNYIAR